MEVVVVMVVLVVVVAVWEKGREKGEEMRVLTLQALCEVRLNGGACDGVDSLQVHAGAAVISR